MGTYLYFNQNNPELIDKTNAILHQVRDGKDLVAHVTDEADRKWQMDNCQCYLTDLGEGSIKLSGDDYVERIYRPLGVFDLIKKAVDETGLVVRVPTGAEYHMEPEEISLFLTPEEFETQRADEEAHSERCKKAREKALRKARKQYKGMGRMFVKGWGGDGSGFYLYLGNIDLDDEPQFLTYTYEVDGEEHSELFRDKDGHAYMPIPLLPFNHDSQEKLFKFFERAWRSGLRTTPNEIMVAIYRMLPDSVMFEGKTMIPKRCEKFYPHYGVPYDMIVIDKDGNPKIEYNHRINNEDLAEGLIRLEAKRKCWIPPVYVTYKTLGRMHGIDIES